MTYIHERPGWPDFKWDSEALAGALGGGAPQAGQAPREDGGARTRLSDRSESHRAHRRGGEDLCHRGAEPQPRRGPLVDRSQARARCRGPSRAEPGSRRHRRDDARCDEELRHATHGGTPLRLACRALSNRPQRDGANHGWRVANRRSGSDAGRLGARRQGESSFRGASGRTPRQRNGVLPAVVQHADGARSGAQGRYRALLVCDHSPVRRRQRAHRSRHR